MNYIKKILRKLSTTTTTFLNHRRMRNNIVLIYSMGKVGSSSIYKTLKKAVPKAHIFHVHFLSTNWLRQILPKLDKDFHQNIVYGDEVLNFIKENPEKRLKIITLVREPLIRDISDIFQNWSRLFPAGHNVDNQYLSTWMNERTHDYTLEWFDTEFQNYLGFDIYGQPFDKDKGYSIYQTSKFDILCIRVENLDMVYKEALNLFLSLDVPLSRENETKDKSRKDLYFEMLMSYRASANKIHRLYSSKYVQHFYTRNEIDEFIKKWSVADEKN